MASDADELPIGHEAGDAPAAVPVRSAAQLGAAVRAQRRRLALKQLDVAGLGNTGNRFIVELENGKPTLQLQKVLDIVDLLGLELVLRPKAGGDGGGA